jgi:hypothetical protein
MVKSTVPDDDTAATSFNLATLLEVPVGPNVISRQAPTPWIIPLGGCFGIDERRERVTIVSLVRNPGGMVTLLPPESVMVPPVAADMFCVEVSVVPGPLFEEDVGLFFAHTKSNKLKRAKAAAVMHNIFFFIGFPP